jgi:hypothetical protein
MLTVYVLVAAIVFSLLTVIWAKDSWLNTSLKALFFVMGIMGWIQFLIQMGYIVKV